MIWVDWHLGQFIELTEILQGSDLKFTITMHYYPHNPIRDSPESLHLERGNS
jgi:hypothetical protein